MYTVHLSTIESVPIICFNDALHSYEQAFAASVQHNMIVLRKNHATDVIETMTPYKRLPTSENASCLWMEQFRSIIRCEDQEYDYREWGCVSIKRVHEPSSEILKGYTDEYLIPCGWVPYTKTSIPVFTIWDQNGRPRSRIDIDVAVALTALSTMNSLTPPVCRHEIK